MAKTPPEIYTSAEITAVLRACCLRSFTGIRAQAIILLAWRAGLRASEIVSLRPSDISLISGELRVINGKGNKTRTVCLDPGTLSLLRTYDTERNRKITLKNRLWICSLFATPLLTSQLRRTLSNLGVRVSLDKRFHCHGLRHTYAVDLLREGFDVYEISRSLGHSSLSTTQVYLEHFAPLALMKKQAARQLPTA